METLKFNLESYLVNGTYQIYPTGQDGSHHCIEIPSVVHEKKAYRKWMHVYSHLRTHKAFLFYNLKESDLIDSRSGKFYTEATDCAYLFSLAEKRDKSPAQIALQWVRAKGALPLVGVRTVKQAKEAIDCLSWKLSSEEVAQIDASYKHISRQTVQNIFQSD